MSSDNSSFFSRNIELLSEKYPSFRKDIVDKFSPSPLLELTETAAGLPGAKIDGNWIHSSRNPEREAEKLIRNSLKSGKGLCMIYGFGLGYHIEAVMKTFPELSILIIEPDPPLFLKALCAKDFSQIITSGRTGFLLDVKPSVIQGVLSSYSKAGIQSLKLRALYDRHLDYYEQIDDEVKAFISKKETNMNTLNRFGKAWVRNLFRNVELFSEARDAGLWYGKFSGFPALVLAAGPSLDDILPVLNSLREKYVIICVDTSLRAVLESGIAPDFIVVVDPQYLNTRHLDNCLDSKTLQNKSILISESSTHPAVFRKSKLPIFFFKSIFPLGKLLEQHAGITSELGAGGSVSTSAWDFARKLGCTEICTSGLDLGFPGGNTHCRSSLSPLVTHLLANRLRPLDTVNFQSIKDASPFLSENNEGGTTMTDRRLIIYKWWFEEQIKAQKKSSPGSPISLLNTSSRGIKIDGMELVSIEQIMRKIGNRTEIDRIKASVSAPIRSKNTGALLLIRESLEAITAECLRLELICGEALEILQSIEENRNKALTVEGFARLSDLDGLISASPSKDLTTFIIQPALNDIIDNDAHVFENSRNLYENIFSACTFHRRLAQQSIDRLKQA
ncbi:MAG: motility associated factor glycosyltransferase family protein [Spirochaetales bacterium]|nr:motility associated factor glycosyltransferase family protein [Spirochaetales bacterium]